jgi:hypothetical protein
MAEHEDIRSGYVEAKRSGVAVQRRSLPNIEEDPVALSLYPQRQAVLGDKAFTGPVVYHDGDSRIQGCHHQSLFAVRHACH